MADIGQKQAVGGRSLPRRSHVTHNGQGAPGPLLQAPYRVGRPLRDTVSGFGSARLGTQCRVLYRIDESKHEVIVQDIQHRSSAYRRR
jgi:mRNA-degrading endonuclease RelE of RelBE toxin-antitoxin system